MFYTHTICCCFTFCFSHSLNRFPLSPSHFFLLPSLLPFSFTFSFALFLFPVFPAIAYSSLLSHSFIIWISFNSFISFFFPSKLNEAFCFLFSLSFCCLLLSRKILILFSFPTRKNKVHSANLSHSAPDGFSRFHLNHSR